MRAPTIVSLFCLFLILVSCGQGEPGKQSTTAAPDSTVVIEPLLFVNGVTEANSGERHGPVQLTVVLDYQDSKGKIILYQIEGKFNDPIDSLEVTGGRCVFKSRDYYSGIYLLALDGNIPQGHPVILNPTEPAIEVVFNTADLSKGLYARNSKENEAMGRYYKQELTHNRMILAKKKERAKSENKVYFDQVIQQEENALHAIQQDLLFKYPNTFFAKYMTWKQNPQKRNKDAYWDNIDFSDPSLVRTRLLHERTQEFFQLYGGSEEAGYIDCIDRIVDKAKANDQVLESTLYILVDGFSQTKYDGVVQYLMDNYIFGEGCGGELSDVLKSRTKGIRNVQIGQVPPDIKMPLLGGGMSNLYAMAHRNKFTMVMFWSSWCEHCEAESPSIKALYEDFKGKGFDILGVSLDKDPAAWEKAVKDRGFDFPQVRGTLLWKSEVALDYHVVATPVFLVLDSDRKIAFRTSKGVSEVRAFLEKSLK